jgi:hypothetical protein
MTWDWHWDRYNYTPPPNILPKLGKPKRTNLANYSPSSPTDEVFLQKKPTLCPKYHFTPHQTIYLDDNIEKTFKEMHNGVSTVFGEMLRRSHDCLLSSQETPLTKIIGVIGLELLNLCNIIFAIFELTSRIIIAFFLLPANFCPGLVKSTPLPLCFSAIANVASTIFALLELSCQIATSEKNICNFKKTVDIARNRLLCKF